MNTTPEFFYNLATGAVEEGRQSSGQDLMGPYSTRAEAERALQTAAARNDAWDEDDAAWEGEDAES
ncbi:SPOR domain-containing protein [Brachybacterium sp. J153]|uniref:SPOR domain-containing protein n=1 Tax=Brachybacterium sp. J153 TaxID=3116488 RepID=UPI002E786AD6|nr:SPOR domain-containing protein [Brachybacterium sp. J153]MEE1617344.1 SPOR domain-containing protein [Brachybacterium sp. J153]